MSKFAAWLEHGASKASFYWLGYLVHWGCPTCFDVAIHRVLSISQKVEKGEFHISRSLGWYCGDCSWKVGQFWVLTLVSVGGWDILRKSGILRNFLRFFHARVKLHSSIFFSFTSRPSPACCLTRVEQWVNLSQEEKILRFWRFYSWGK